MEFSTYAELQDAIADFLNRPDLLENDAISGAITLTEARMRRLLRRTSAKATLTFTSGQASKALPATATELRSIAPAVTVGHPRGGPPLELVTKDALDTLRWQGPSQGCPRYYTIINNTVYVAPAPTDAYLDFDIVTFTKLVPLSDSNTSNAVLAEAPDAYLYGACVELAAYLEHDERVPKWDEKFLTAIGELNTSRQNEEFGANLKRARLPVVFGG